MCSRMMFPIKLSRYIPIFGVNDMGRISEVIDLGWWTFGLTCAFFQSIGILPSANDLLNMAHIGGPTRPAKSFRVNRLDQWICEVSLSSTFSQQLPMR